MDEAVIRYYRNLLRTGFEYAGSLENPSVFLDTLNEDIPVCGNAGNYLHLYLNIRDGIVEDIRYLCICDPVANVAIEIMCGLVRGKSVEEIGAITDDSFLRIIESHDEDLKAKARVLLELLNQGVDRFRTTNSETNHSDE